MADKETNQKKGADAPEQKKVVTRYERRLQRRKEEEETRKRKQRTTAGIAALVVLACVGVGGYRAYSNYQENHGPYFSVGSHKVSRSEFNYFYNSSINSFYSQYGSFASYFGLDMSKPLEQQYYSDTMTWKDYFEQQAATQLQQMYALTDEASAQNFTYDAAEDVSTFVESLQSSADEAELSIDEYCARVYGEETTLDAVKKYVEMSSTANAYYESIKDGLEITEDEITSYYDEHKADYDSVDYMVCKVEADIPEPETEAETEAPETEAAQTEAAESTDETAAETEAAESTDETAVETEVPETEDNSAEIQAAMDEAKAKAEAMKAKVKDAASFESAAAEYATDPEAQTAYTNSKKSSVSNSDVGEWLFDDARAAGDVEVIEDTAGNAYYVAMFQKRYLDHVNTVDVRHILIQPEETEEEAPAEAEAETEAELTEEEAEEAEAVKAAEKAAAMEKAKAEAERIYAEWQAGEKTEDSFAEMAKQYSGDTGSVSEGGLYEAVEPGQMVQSFNDWIFDANRKTGDTDIVETDYGYHIMYFVGQNAETWHVDVKNEIVSEKMSEYMDGLLENVKVSDPRGHLAYLKIPAETEASETETAAETAGETAAETETEKK